MYSMNQTDVKALIILSISFMFSLIYAMNRWPYTPETVMQDLERLGPYGLLIDLAFILFVFFWIRNRGNQKQDNL